MARIRIPTPLRPYTGGQEVVDATGATVGEVLDNLAHAYPELEQHLFDGGELRSFVNVFVGEEDIRHLRGTETPVEEGARLLIIPSIAGGS